MVIIIIIIIRIRINISVKDNIDGMVAMMILSGYCSNKLMIVIMFMM